MADPAYLTLDEVAAETRHTRSAVAKWISGGVTVAGRRVRLVPTRVGGRVYVTPDQLAAFLRACNPDAGPLPESPAARTRRAERAQAAALAALGVR